MRIFISACLLGCPCRYDGAAKPCAEAIALSETHSLVPFCPEAFGGLTTPRKPAEIRCGRVQTADGTDVTEQYRRGAEAALNIYRITGCELAVCKEKSPSCGHGRIYDGSHTGTLIPGDGITTALFLQNNIPVIGESEIAEYFGCGRHTE